MKGDNLGMSDIPHNYSLRPNFTSSYGLIKECKFLLNLLFRAIHLTEAGEYFAGRRSAIGRAPDS